MISSIEEIVKLVKSGFSDWKEFGRVRVRQMDDLFIFNYTQEVQYEGNWNFFEIVSRGLIISSSGEIIARPFDKFFNWGENGTTESPIKTVTEKLDGVLGILYRHKNEYRVATRGSFDSDQAVWATAFLKKNFPEIEVPEELTLLFEIIYPENRIVVNYGDKTALVLLAARNRFSGEYLPYEEVVALGEKLGFEVTKSYTFENPEEMIKVLPLLDQSKEGFVAEFMDGQRFKFKGDTYKELHRLISGLTLKRVLESYSEGNHEAYRAVLPEELLPVFDGFLSQVVSKVGNVKAEAETAFSVAPKGSRKEFALWSLEKEQKRLSPYLFALWEGKEIFKLICSREF